VLVNQQFRPIHPRQLTAAVWWLQFHCT